MRVMDGERRRMREQKDKCEGKVRIQKENRKDTEINQE